VLDGCKRSQKVHQKPFYAPYVRRMRLITLHIALYDLNHPLAVAVAMHIVVRGVCIKKKQKAAFGW